jgi:hypothetical protein
MDLEIDTSQLQRILEIEDENDAATTPHGDAPVKKKRVRTTTTSLACETCRLKVRTAVKELITFFFSPHW